MGVLFTSSFVIILFTILYLTSYYITEHYDTFLEIIKQINLKAYIALSIGVLISFVIIFGYMTSISDGSDVLGTSISNGGAFYFMLSFVGLFAFVCLSICMKLAMEVNPEEKDKYGMLNRLYINLASICSLILLVAILTTTQNKSLTQRFFVLVAGCVILLHVNIIHRMYWMCYPEEDSKQ